MTLPLKPTRSIADGLPRCYSAATETSPRTSAESSTEFRFIVASPIHPPGPRSRQRCKLPMVEVVGITSGLLPLAVAAYGASKSLHEAVSNLQSQRKTIRDIRDDSRSLVAVLETIEERIQGSSDLERLEPLRPPLDCCTTACQEMHEMLDACTIHSTDDRNHVRDWLNMRFHGKDFEDIKQRLCSCKLRLILPLA